MVDNISPSQHATLPERIPDHTRFCQTSVAFCKHSYEEASALKTLVNVFTTSMWHIAS